MTSRRITYALRPFALPAVLLALFEWYARRAAAAGSDALAPPSAALNAWVGAALDGSLWQATGFTLGTAALGLAIGAGLGTVLGIALGLSRRAAQMGFLTIEALRPVAKIATVADTLKALG